MQVWHLAGTTPNPDRRDKLVDGESFAGCIVEMGVDNVKKEPSCSRPHLTTPEPVRVTDTQSSYFRLLSRESMRGSTLLSHTRHAG
jgi:hypothetical protein